MKSGRLRSWQKELYKIVRDVTEVNGQSLSSGWESKTRGQIYKVRGKRFKWDLKGKYTQIMVGCMEQAASASSSCSDRYNRTSKRHVDGAINSKGLEGYWPKAGK